MGVKMHAHSFTPDKLLRQSDSVTSLIDQVITKNVRGVGFLKFWRLRTEGQTFERLKNKYRTWFSIFSFLFLKLY